MLLDLTANNKTNTVVISYCQCSLPGITSCSMYLRLPTLVTVCSVALFSMYTMQTICIVAETQDTANTSRRSPPRQHAPYRPAVAHSTGSSRWQARAAIAASHHTKTSHRCKKQHMATHRIWDSMVHRQTKRLRHPVASEYSTGSGHACFKLFQEFKCGARGKKGSPVMSHTFSFMNA